jgi:hypothetical protein
MAGVRAVRHNRGVFEIGASLREARLKRGLSPADVNKALRIRDRYLQALEEERWELLPGDAYAKGFLREYADFLGLDGNLYVDEYNSRVAQQHEEPPLAPQPLPKSDFKGRRTGGVGILRPLLAIGAIVAIVAAVAAWQLDRGSNKASPPTTTNQTTTGGTTTTKHHTPPPATLPKTAVLVASRGATWLDVRYGSQSGRLIYENTLPQGQTVKVPLTHGPVWMRIGLPANLDVRVGGKLAHGLPSQVGNVLLTQHGLKPA